MMSSLRELKTRPNVIFITVDHWRGDLTPGMQKWVPTPNLDRLAAESVRFDRHFCQAYPCGPARAGLITGLYAHKHRSIRNGTPLDRRHRTLFQAARARGYAPILFGYTDTTADPRRLASHDPARANYEGVAAGLDIGCLLDERASNWIALLQRRGFKVPEPWLGRSSVFGMAAFGKPTVFDAEDSETAFLTDRLIDHLNVQGPEPFFIHASYIAPHPPFAASRKWLDRIDAREIKVPRVDEGQNHPLLDAYRSSIELSDFAPGVHGLVSDADDDLKRNILHAYAALMAEVDDHIGRIIELLKQQGKWDNTIFIFSGDHGEQLFDHGFLGKLGWFDSSAHIPLIIRMPDQANPRVVDSFTQSVDIFPTLVDLLDLQDDVNLDGMSLVPFLQGSDPQWRDFAHWSHDFGNLATLSMERTLGLATERCQLQVIRTDDFKYVHFQGLPSVLYDLKEDPEERVNLASDAKGGQLRAEGVERLLKLRLEHENRELSCLQAVDRRLYGSRTGVDGAVNFD